MFRIIAGVALLFAASHAAAADRVAYQCTGDVGVNEIISDFFGNEPREGGGNGPLGLYPGSIMDWRIQRKVTSVRVYPWGPTKSISGEFTTTYVAREELPKGSDQLAVIQVRKSGGVIKLRLIQTEIAHSEVKTLVSTCE